MIKKYFKNINKIIDISDHINKNTQCHVCIENRKMSRQSFIHL